MTPILLLIAAANLGGFLFRALRWARTNSGFSAAVAGAHLMMALLLGSAALIL
jgi:hypothetical protein